MFNVRRFRRKLKHESVQKEQKISYNHSIFFTKASIFYFNICVHKTMIVSKSKGKTPI